MTNAPEPLGYEATITALEGELDKTIVLARHATADLGIPTCPGWTAGVLLRHLGTVHRWASATLETRATERISRRNLDVDAPTDDDWAPWMATGAHRLLEALRSTPGDEPVWSWGADQHARWWARRQLHETVVHRADLSLAMGEAFELEAHIAADGIGELLDNSEVRLTWADATPPSVDATVHLHATDTDPTTGASPLTDSGEWMVNMSGGGISHSHGHGKGDAAARGPVTQLMLMMNQRVDPASAGIEVFGDAEALGQLVSAVSL